MNDRFLYKSSDPVLTFKLLEGANLTNDEKKLAQNMKSESMKSELEHLFSKTKSCNVQTDRH